MPRFYNPDKNYLLVTSFKVMYSTLYHQKNLLELSGKKVALLLLSENLKSKKIKKIILVRNPYNRLVSFYSDKFIKHPLTSKNKNFDGWQPCQKIFFPHLGISSNDNNTVICDKFINTTFEYFIKILPFVFNLEAHLHPQSELFYLKKYFIKIKLKFDEIIKLENMHKELMLNELNIDIGTVKNITSHKAYNEYFKKPLYQIVNRLYDADFKNFAYKLE